MLMENVIVRQILLATNAIHALLVFITFRLVKVNLYSYFINSSFIIIIFLTWFYFISQLATVTHRDLLAILVMIMVNVVVKLMSSMTNVMPVWMVFPTFRLAKVSIIYLLSYLYCINTTLINVFRLIFNILFFVNFSL